MTTIIGRRFPVLMGQSMEIYTKKPRFTSTEKNQHDPTVDEVLKKIGEITQTISHAVGAVSALPGAIYGGHKTMKISLKDKDPADQAIVKSTAGAIGGGSIGYFLGRVFPVLIPVALYYVYLRKIKQEG